MTQHNWQSAAVLGLPLACAGVDRTYVLSGVRREIPDSLG